MTPPTRYALVLCDARVIAWVNDTEGCRDNGVKDAMAWQEGEFSTPLYAACPNGGAVTQEMLERAAREYYEEAIRQCLAAGIDPLAWNELPAIARSALISRERAALTALGLTVADAREEAGNG